MAETSYRQDLTTHPDYAELQQRAARITSSGGSVAIDGLVLLAGAWLAIAPWVLGFSATNHSLTVNDLILGILVMVLAIGLTMAPERMYRLSWAMVAIGLWTIAAPFVMSGTSGFVSTSGMYWTNIATGIVIAVLGFAAVGLLMASGRGVAAARRGFRSAGREGPRGDREALRNRDYVGRDDRDVPRGDREALRNRDYVGRDDRDVPRGDREIRRDNER